MPKRITAIFLILLFCLLNAGCAFHPRSAAAFPQALRTLYFSSVKPFSVFSNRLHSTLTSLNVVFVKKESDARYSLLITRDHFSYARPDIVDATLPTTIGFSQTIKITIQDNRTHKKIISRGFSSTDSLTLNANQIYTANANGLIQEQLNHELISLVYYWLTSKQTQDALNHAAHAKTTRHAS